MLRNPNNVVFIVRSFIEYIKAQPLIFEVYGHFQAASIQRERKVSFLDLLIAKFSKVKRTTFFIKHNHY
jgi:hypothetical protein